MRASDLIWGILLLLPASAGALDEGQDVSTRRTPEQMVAQAALLEQQAEQLERVGTPSTMAFAGTLRDQARQLRAMAGEKAVPPKKPPAKPVKPAVKPPTKAPAPVKEAEPATPSKEGAPVKKLPDKEDLGFLAQLRAELTEYPENAQQGYKVFAVKCAKCHSLTKSFQAQVPNDDWEPCIRKMAKMQGANISPKAVKQITVFMNFWQKRVREGGVNAPPPPPGQEGQPSESVAGGDKFPQVGYSGCAFISATQLASDRHARDTMREEGLMAEFVFTTNATLTDRMTVNATLCYSCHALELDHVYAEYDLSESFRLRAGRFAVPFGAVSQRYLPQIRESTSLPLPYAMGRMPRDREFNQGVLPMPITDNGAMLTGAVYPTESMQLDASAYLVTGMKGTDVDLDFISTRDYEDNNGEPAAGLRFTATWDYLSLGASFMRGNYDAEGDLAYRVYGLDFFYKLGEFNLRAEFVRREQDFFIGGPDTSKDAFIKEGYFIQLDGPFPLIEGVRFFLLQDGLSMRDILLSPSGPTPVPSPDTTDNANAISRFAAGLEFSPYEKFVVKGSVEYWYFSDYDETWVFNLGVSFSL
ncbi:MAG: cytochrome c [Planctomycetes bacterium]|nr:cytochrome c [Planctomycetota bacterium]